MFIYFSEDISNIVSHPVHLKNKSNAFFPSALIPYCAFKSNLTMETEDTHPNISFPICTSFVPDILEGQLCYTIKHKGSGGKAKINGLMLLVDLNTQRYFQTNPRKKRTIKDKSKMILDTELSRRDTSAKIQINSMSPFTAYGHGTYMMTSVKKMKATRDFLGMNPEVRYCEHETYEECRTRHMLKRCECVPWELQQLHIKVNSFINFGMHAFFRRGRFVPRMVETVWTKQRVRLLTARPLALESTPMSRGTMRR